GREHAEVLLLLLVGAAEEDGGEGELVRGDAGLDARAAVRELLGDEGVLELGHARSAVLRRDARVDEADVPGGPEHVHGELRVAVTLGRDGDDALLREPARGLDEAFVLFTQRKVDHDRSSKRRVVPPPEPFFDGYRRRRQTA